MRFTLSHVAAMACTLVSCTAPTGPAGGGGGDGETDDTGLSTSMDGTDFADVELIRSELVPTVLTVTWTTPTPTSGRVRFGEGSGLDDAALEYSTAWSTDLTTSHTAVLIGLPEGVEGTARIDTMDAEGQLTTSDSLALQTGLLASELPRPYEVERIEADLASGFTLVPMRHTTSMRQWVSILDGRGRPVWAIEAHDTSHRLRLRPNGQGIVYMNMSPGPGAMSLISVDWDGTVHSELVVEGGFQDFDVVTDDSYLALTQTSRSFDFPDGTAEVLSDAVAEVGLDGSVRVVWSLLDHFPPSLDAPAPDAYMHEGAIDWSHTNYLDHDPHSDAVLLTMKHLHAAAAVDRSTGDILWTLAQNFGDYAPREGERVLFGPHSVQVIDDGVLLFNHGDGDSFCAGAVEVALSEGDSEAEVGSADVTWQATGGTCMEMHYLGNAQRLDNGNTLATYSHMGFTEEYNSEGRLVQRFESPVGSFFLYAERVDALGLPR